MPERKIDSWLVKHFGSKLLDGLPQNLVQMFMVLRGWILKTLVTL